MDKIQQYKDRFSSYTNTQLKDVIAGRFDDGEPEIEAIKAAMQLLKARQSNTPMPLSEIPKAKNEQLKEIIENPEEWGEEALELAKKTVIQREHKALEDIPLTSDTSKFFSIFMIILAAIGIPIFLYILYYIIYLLFWLR